jgi:fructose-1,6-bisphosphatase/inositol monophosphatase family enzyme
MVQEAGGMATDFFGKPLGLSGKHVLASNGKIHKAMLRLVKMGEFPK